MLRLARVGTSLLLSSLLFACPARDPDCDPGQELATNTGPQGAAACGDLSTFDLSACDPASLQGLELTGVWNTNSEWTWVAPSPAAMHAAHPESEESGDEGKGVWTQMAQFPAAMNLLPGTEALNGRALYQKQLGCGAFYVSNRFTSRGRTLRYAYAACQGIGPRGALGVFHYCVDGELAASGEFEARRVVRQEGEVEASGLELVGQLPLSGSTADVYVWNQHAFVTRFRDGVSVVDVSDPASPRLVTTFAVGEDYWNDGWVLDGVLYLSGAENGLVYYDVSTPSAPELIGQWPAPGTESVDVHTTFIDGELLYAISPWPTGEVAIFDVSVPRAPLLLSRFKAELADSSTRWPHDAFAFDGKLYVSHWALGLVVVDVSDPQNPFELGRYGHPLATSHANGVVLQGGRVLVFEGGESWGAHLRVLDATDPAAITLVGEWQTRPEVSIHNLLVQNAKVYTAHYHDGIRILDVSDPANPVQTAYFNTWREDDPGRGRSFYDGAIGIRMPGDGFIYAIDIARGLLILREL